MQYTRAREPLAVRWLTLAKYARGLFPCGTPSPPAPRQEYSSYSPLVPFTLIFSVTQIISKPAHTLDQSVVSPGVNPTSVKETCTPDVVSLQFAPDTHTVFCERDDRDGRIGVVVQRKERDNVPVCRAVIAA
jgi:hypothetical protein